MLAKDYIDKIFIILSQVQNDKEKLKKILSFLETDILPLPEDEDEMIPIPEKFEPLVNSIAQSLDTGFVCFLNPDTLELEEIPKDLLDLMWLYGAEEENTDDEWGPLKHPEWAQVIRFEAPDSSNGFRIMKDFAGQINNFRTRDQLMDILNNRKPFAHFNNFIHNSNYREQWFAFKTAAHERHVREIIYDHFNKI